MKQKPAPKTPTLKKKSSEKIKPAKVVKNAEVIPDEDFDEVEELAASANLPVPKKSYAVGPSLTSDDPMAIYLRQIQRIPLLNPSEEKDLARKAFDDKDKEAAKKLIQANLRFVVKIAFEYARFGHKVLDLVQEGNVGLIQAVHHFNPYKEVRLTTYAVWWIRSYIRDYLIRNWSIVRIGTTAAQKKLFYNLRKEQEKWERLGIKPQVKAIAHNLHVSEDDVETMQQRMSGKDSSLSPRPGMGGEENFSPESTLRDEGPLPSARLEQQEDSWLIQKALEEFQEELDDREKDFVKRRLLSETPVTLEEFGKDYNISKERSRQIEERIKSKLKEYLSKYYPEISLD